MSCKLRDFIRRVRACKTAAEEREIIAKESAALRAAFKDDNPKRHRNVAKLMFMHMLGYPTHFGQMECLKLIAETEFPEKRMGYLGFMLLLDEKQELLMMVTNSIKNDLKNANQFIVGIALCALSNLCSAQMANDLAPEVALLLQNGNPYIRKKAALCCVKVIRKNPDLADSLLNPATTLLSDKHHGVLVATIKLWIVLCQTSSNALEHLRKQTSNVVQILKNLLTSEHRPEYDVSGIVDPLLQIELLRLLRLAGRSDSDSSDIMSDVLAQVVTNTDSSKVPGSAIIYECVQTIMAIEGNHGLRVLGINVLGQFLSNHDNNIRYVALNMLVKIVPVDSKAIQRHRSIVIECLKDADISIRKRALELVYALANESNVKGLTKDLLEYLKKSDREFKEDLTMRICSVIQKFASSKMWFINQMVDLICEAGEFLTNESIHTLIVIVSNTPELHGYTVRLVYQKLENYKKQERLVLLALWCIGEYGEMLINHAGELETEEPVTITELEVLERLEEISTSFWSSEAIKAFLLVSLLKISSRYSTCTEKIKMLISKYKNCTLMDLQQRAVEFESVLVKHLSMRDTLVQMIPVLDGTEYQKKRANPAVAALSPSARVSSPTPNSEALGQSNPLSAEAATVDLINFLDLNIENKDAQPSVGLNELADLLEPGPKSNIETIQSSGLQKMEKNPSRVEAFQSLPISPSPLILGDALSQFSPFIGDEQHEKSSTIQGPVFPSIVVLQTSRLKVLFEFTKESTNPRVTTIHATCFNNSPDLCTDLMLQAAVPKYLHLKLDPASSNVLLPNSNGTVTQHITVTNSLHGQKPLLMRVKITYKVGGQEITEQSQIENFPAGL